MRKTVQLFPACVIMGLLSTANIGSARAQDLLWSMPASACVPDHSSIAGSKYVVNSNTVSFQAGQTGDIHLTCPVPPIMKYSNFYDENIWQMVGFFIAAASGDGDGTGVDDYVEVSLRRAYSDWQAICTVKSRSLSFGEINCNFPPFRLSPANGHYFFYVRLHRSGTTSNPTFYGVRIGCPEGWPCSGPS
jgi:hypothetical protein